MDERDKHRDSGICKLVKQRKLGEISMTMTKPKNGTEPGLLVVEHGVLTLLLKSRRGSLYNLQ
jgi:hypothetical protein